MEGLVHSLKEESGVWGGWGPKRQSVAGFCGSLGGRLRCHTHLFFQFIWKVGDL